MVLALKCYERVRSFVTDFRKSKGALYDKDVLSPEGYQQIQIADDMIDLLPQKISKLNY